METILTDELLALGINNIKATLAGVVFRVIWKRRIVPVVVKNRKSDFTGTELFEVKAKKIFITAYKNRLVWAY